MLKLSEKKRVHWQDKDVPSDKPTELLSQFKKAKSSPNFSKLKTQMLDIFRGNDYFTLLPLFVNDVLPTSKLQEDFFNSQGNNILAFLLVYNSNLETINLIKKLFTPGSLQTAIKNEESSCLKKFLIAQASQETFSKDNEITRNLRVEKFKFLLEIDYAMVKDYFSHPDQRYFTKKIQEDFLKAIQETDQPQNNFRI